MKKILITQRLTRIGIHKELRDNIDIRLPNFIERLNFLPILMPNDLDNPAKFIKNIKFSGVILSGGDDPRKKDKRTKNEKFLINYCLKNEIPLLGICRGAQMINLHLGGKLKKIKNHVRKKHTITGPAIKSKLKIKSYHDYGFSKKILAKNLTILAQSSDKIVKFFCHNNYKLFGIMWHPERNMRFKNFDINLIKKIFDK